MGAPAQSRGLIGSSCHSRTLLRLPSEAWESGSSLAASQLLPGCMSNAIACSTARASFGVVDDRAGLGVEVLGARVEVEGADVHHSMVHDHGLGVQRDDRLGLVRGGQAREQRALCGRLRLELMDLEAQPQQALALAAVAGEGHQVVGGGERVGVDAHSHAARHGAAEQVDRRVGDHEVRRLDSDRLLRAPRPDAPALQSPAHRRRD